MQAPAPCKGAGGGTEPQRSFVLRSEDSQHLK
jgi:hypothetical protein